MFANLLSCRPSLTRKRDKYYKANRLFVETLEDRRLLATLIFDTELVSLDLSGGPYPIPLASDPANLLGDSIEGYGFVDSEVTISLSSQRPGSIFVPGPGPPSPGKVCATNEPGDPDGNRGCLFGAPAPETEPIDPEELDGQRFIVDSFFDVFFDITVTDVDTRPGRDFAGMPDGASVLLPDNGPANMLSHYEVIFDADAPNFGIIPPPQVAPYIGHFQIEIPLGGDINGNGEPDKIKFTIASHAAGDGNRTFTQLPDGTILDEFDSAAFLAGAIVDQSTDPPFTLGAGSSSAPAFSGPGALTGPTSATSILLNPLAAPNFSYVDADNDQIFTAGVDVELVNGELADGRFDTNNAEGGYTSVIPGAGLVVQEDITVNRDLELKAEGDLFVSAGVTLSSRRDIELEAGGKFRVLPGSILTIRDLEIKAEGDIDVSGGTLAAGKELEIEAGGSVLLDSASITTRKEVEIKADADVFLDDASITARKEIEIEAGGFVSLLGSLLHARKEIEIKAKDDIFAFLAEFSAGKEILLQSEEGSVDLTGGNLHAGKEFTLDAFGSIIAAESNIAAGKEIKIKSDEGDVDLTDATLTARKEIEVEAEKIDDTGATLTAKKVKLIENNP